MAYYTNISLSEANTILSLYDLPMATNLTPISHGISNSNYIAKLQDSKEVILKISNDKNDQQLLEEQHILLNLNHLGFHYAPTPLMTKAGSPVYVSKPWHGVVFPRIKGGVPQLTPSTCHHIGKALAVLHHQSRQACLNGLPYPLRNAEDIGYFPQDIADFTKDPKCPADFRLCVLEHLPDDALAFYSALENQLPRAILHGDLYFDNTLFDKDELITMLDFEQAGVGPCIFDLGISISGSCMDNKKLSLHLVTSYLQGYCSVRPLSKSEKELLYSQIICGFLSISLWRIHRFLLGNLSLDRKNSYQELLTYANETAKFFSPTKLDDIIKDL